MFQVPVNELIKNETQSGSPLPLPLLRTSKKLLKPGALIEKEPDVWLTPVTVSAPSNAPLASPVLSMNILPGNVAGLFPGPESTHTAARVLVTLNSRSAVVLVPGQETVAAWLEPKVEPMANPATTIPKATDLKQFMVTLPTLDDIAPGSSPPRMMVEIVFCYYPYNCTAEFESVKDDLTVC
jgi:hypothetical protein